MICREEPLVWQGHRREGPSEEVPEVSLPVCLSINSEAAEL